MSGATAAAPSSSREVDVRGPLFTPVAVVLLVALVTMMAMLILVPRAKGPSSVPESALDAPGVHHLAAQLDEVIRRLDSLEREVAALRGKERGVEMEVEVG